MKISVVVPVYNGGESFRHCLASIAASQRLPDEVVVVSDGDTDGSWQAAEAFGAKVVKLSGPGGPARARNAGARVACGDILLFIDADVTLHHDTLELVVQRFSEDPDLDASIGSYDDEPGAENFLSQYKNLFHHYTHQVSSEAASTFWGACGAIRQQAFWAVGGFDESYRKPCVEDIDLGYRLKRAGYTIRLCKDIQIKHLKRWKPLSLLKAEVFYRALPWTELMLRNARFDTDLNLSPANRVSVMCTFGLVASAIASVLVPEFGLVALGLSLTLLALNADVYRFFYRKRGLVFTLRVIPWHWFYFLYGGATFLFGLVEHSWNRFVPLPDMTTVNWAVRRPQHDMH